MGPKGNMEAEILREPWEDLEVPSASIVPFSPFHTLQPLRSLISESTVTVPFGKAFCYRMRGERVESETKGTSAPFTSRSV